MTIEDIGTTARRTATQLAEDAIARMSPRRKYGVALDRAGHVLVGGPDDFRPSELLMVCTAKSDPDILADNIRDEAAARGPRTITHRVNNRKTA
jgi:hypothetical protein